MVLNTEDIPALEAATVERFLSHRHEWGPEGTEHVTRLEFVPGDNRARQHPETRLHRECACGLRILRKEDDPPFDTEMLQRVADYINEKQATDK